MTIRGFDFDVVDQIVQECQKPGVDLPPLLILALAHQEGGLKKPFPVGDGGTSFGPFQIHLPSHPAPVDVGPEHWNNPVNAMREMLPRWKKWFAHYGGHTAFFNDRADFIRLWAPRAQGSIDWNWQHAYENLVEAGNTLYEYQKQKRDVDLALAAQGIDDIRADMIEALERSSILWRQLEHIDDMMAVQSATHKGLEPPVPLG